MTNPKLGNPGKNQRYLKLKQSLFSNFTLLLKVWSDKQLTYLFIQNKEFQAMPTSYETYNLISFHDVILFKYTESRPEKKDISKYKVML